MILALTISICFYNPASHRVAARGGGQAHADGAAAGRARCKQRTQLIVAGGVTRVLMLDPQPVGHNLRMIERQRDRKQLSPQPWWAELTDRPLSEW